MIHHGNDPVDPELKGLSTWGELKFYHGVRKGRLGDRIECGPHFSFVVADPVRPSFRRHPIKWLRHRKPGSDEERTFTVMYAYLDENVQNVTVWDGDRMDELGGR